MEAFQYVIIGGGLAGGRAADGIRKVDSEGTVVLVTLEPHRPYQRPPLSKSYLVGKVGLDRVYLEQEGHYEQNRIELMREVRATQIDPGAHTVTLDNGGILQYQKLLIATGGYAWRLPLPGNDLERVFTLRTIEDSQNIRQAGMEGSQALILGGSFIGSEVAASLTQRGARVTMLFPESRLLERVVPQELSKFLQAMYRQRGVRILPGITAERLEGNRQVQQAMLSDGQRIPADLVVMGVGIRLNTKLARDAGLQLGEQDAIVVDEYLRTSHPDIYAAGDLAAWPDPTFGKRLRVEHWDVARRQGARAGRNMAGEQKRYTEIPYFFSDMFELSFEAWGDLSDWDQTVLRGSLDKGSFAFFYFRQGRMVGMLAVDRPDQETEPMKNLLKARSAYAKVADQLANESVELESLARQYTNL